MLVPTWLVKSFAKPLMSFEAVDVIRSRLCHSRGRTAPPFGLGSVIG